ncbi:unnamed protein product, partial [Lampetra planeri]
LVVNALEALDGCFAIAPPGERERSKQTALELATTMLSMPAPPGVHQQTKVLLAGLHSSRNAYHSHKVTARHGTHSLASAEPLDPETFHRVVVTARAVATMRPANPCALHGHGGRDGGDDSNRRAHRRWSSSEQPEPEHGDFEMVPEGMVLEGGADVAAAGAGESPLEALLAGAEGFPPTLDIPPDADDETMVELAIALSLQQDQQAGGGGAMRLQSLVLPAQTQSSSSLDAGTLSDTTASAPASDDEGSTMATDGSTLRTSPAEPHAGSAAGSSSSESGGSAVGSVAGDHNVSGRSSAYGDGAAEGPARGPGSVTSSTGAVSTTMGAPRRATAPRGRGEGRRGTWAPPTGCTW